MHAEDADGTGFASVTGEGDGGPEAVVEAIGVEEFAEEAFATDAEEEGAAGDFEGLEVTEESEVMVEGFAESDAGVEEDGLGMDAGMGGGVEL